jgi:hypothetical protein
MFLAREWGRYVVRVNSITPGFFPAIQNQRLLFAAALRPASNYHSQPHPYRAVRRGERTCRAVIFWRARPQVASRQEPISAWTAGSFVRRSNLSGRLTREGARNKAHLRRSSQRKDQLERAITAGCCVSQNLFSCPNAHLVQMLQHLGGILVNTVSAGFLELLRPVAARE